MTTSPIRRLGAHPVAVWAIKHVASPLDRLVVKVFGGRIPQPSSLVLPTLLLTTVGRRSGLERTVPLVFVRDGERYVVANARPSGERRNPWVANLRAAGTARVKHGRRSVDVIAHEIGETGVERWWPALVDVWPAFGEHFAATGERTVFVLEPVDSGANGVVADVPG
jgi:deazaflavin-dependent oxidoreductase (nitroreductase family)